jgi:hypothetical protein
MMIFIDLRWCGEGGDRTEQHVDSVEEPIDPLAKCARRDRAVDVDERVARPDVGERVARKRAVIQSAAWEEPCVRGSFRRRTRW